jgi:transposase
MAPWRWAAASAICERLQPIGADMAYRGQRLRTWVEEDCGWILEIVQRPQRWGWYPSAGEPPPMPALTVLPRRWVVERTLAGRGRYRRLSTDYAYLPESSETMIDLAMSRLMLRRLAREAPYGVPSPQRQGLRPEKSSGPDQRKSPRQFCGAFLDPALELLKHTFHLFHASGQIIDMLKVL